MLVREEIHSQKPFLIAVLRYPEICVSTLDLEEIQHYYGITLFC